MGEAFCQPNTTPLLPVRFASRMSSTEVMGVRRSDQSSRRSYHPAMLSIASWNFSNMAIVALNAVTRPAYTPSRARSESQLLTFRPSITIASS